MHRLAAGYMPPRCQSRVDEARRIEPPTTWEEIDLRSVVGKTCAELGGRMVMRWRHVWIIRRGKCPLKVVWKDRRKERKL